MVEAGNRGADSARLWAAGEAYEPYVGRWSRVVAPGFLAGLGVAAGGRWLDVGCGTGALTGAILAAHAPAAVTGVDPSEASLPSRDPASPIPGPRSARATPGRCRWRMATSMPSSAAWC